MPLGQALLPTAEQQPQQMVWAPPCPPGPPTAPPGPGLAGAERGPRTRRVLGFPCSEEGSRGRWGFSLPWTEPTPGPIVGTLWAGPGWRAPAGRPRARGPEIAPQRQPRPADAPDGVPGENLQHWQGPTPQACLAPPAAAQVSSLCGRCPKCPLPAPSQSPAPARTSRDQMRTRPHGQRPDSRLPGAGAGV